MSDIRGLMIHSRLDYVENLPDRKHYQQLLQHLGKGMRQSIGEQVFMTNSYPFSLLKELDKAIGEILNSPLETISVILENGLPTWCFINIFSIMSSLRIPKAF